jgi:hypothetical protein
MNTLPQLLRVNRGLIGSAWGMSEFNVSSDGSDEARPNMGGKGKRNPSPLTADEWRMSPQLRLPLIRNPRLMPLLPIIL